MSMGNCPFLKRNREEVDWVGREGSGLGRKGRKRQERKLREGGKIKKMH